MIWKPVLLALALGALAGFDPWKELPGYQQAFLSEHSDLYDFTSFEAHEGKRLSGAKLAEVRADWVREQERVAEQLRTLEADPSRAYLRRLRTLLAQDRFFKSVTFEERRGASDVLLLVQVPPKASRHYVDGVAQNYVPHIEALSRQFHAAYVEPLGLKRRDDAAFVVIVSLKSRGAYDDYARSTPGGTAKESVLAHFDPRHRIAVVWEPGTDPDAPILRERREVLAHEAVHALLDAYTTADEPVSRWLNEGLAEYWSHSLGLAKTGSLEFRKRPVEPLLNWRGLRVSAASDAVIPPIEAMIGYRTYADADNDIMGRVAAAGATISAVGARLVFYNTACLYTMFLAEGAEESVRARFPKLLQAELVGRRGVDAFKDALGVDDLEALDRAFVEWADVLASGGRPEDLVAAGSSAADGADVPTPEHARVDLGLGEPTDEERLGERLLRAGELDFDAALAEPSPLAPDDRVFLGRARDHVTAVLEAAKAARQNVVVGAAGGKVTGKVTRVGGRDFEVTPFKRTPVVVERAALDLDFLEKYARRHGVEDAEVQGGLQLLGQGKLALATPEGMAAWKRFGERWLRAIDAAAAREHLERVAAAARDPDVDPTQAIESVEALFDAYATAAAVTARKERLKDAARALYMRTYDPAQHANGMFAVPAVDVGDGVLELHYDFSDPGQLRDFLLGDAVPEFVSSVTTLLPITGRSGTWRVTGGALEATGDAQLAHRGLFEGPALLQFGETVQQGSGTTSNFGGFARVCTDRRFVGVLNMNLVAATPNPRYAGANQNLQLIIGSEVSWTVAVDEMATLRFGDQEIARTSAPLRRAGAPALVNRGPGPTRLNWLKIRGRVSDEFTRQRRDEWVAKRLEALEPSLDK